MSRADQRQQLVGDVLTRHRASVFVSAAQHQRQDVGALVEMRVRLGLVDQRVHGAVEVAAEFCQSGPRAVAPEARRRLGQRRHARPQLRPRRDDLPEKVEFDTVGSEDGSQDHVQRDPVHRLECPKLLALRPIGALAQGLFLDDLLVVLDALAVERRGEQLAAVAMLRPVQRENRTGPEDPAQVGVDIDQVIRARHEHLTDQRRVGDQHGMAEEREVEDDDPSVAAERLVQHPPAKAREGNSLDRLRQPQRRWPLRGLGRRGGLRVDGGGVSHASSLPIHPVVPQRTAAFPQTVLCGTVL